MNTADERVQHFNSDGFLFDVGETCQQYAMRTVKRCKKVPKGVICKAAIKKCEKKKPSDMIQATPKEDSAVDKQEAIPAKETTVAAPTITATAPVETKTVEVEKDDVAPKKSSGTGGVEKDNNTMMYVIGGFVILAAVSVGGYLFYKKMHPQVVV